MLSLFRRRLCAFALLLVAMVALVGAPAHAAAVKTTIAVKLTVTETGGGDLSPATVNHVWPLTPALQTVEFATGVGDNQVDRIWSDQRTVTAAADDLDLRGGLTDTFGTSLNFVEVCAIAIYNRDTTDTLSVGADAAAITTLWGASGDIIKIPPGGYFVWFAPAGCIATTATTADILQIDPGANTVIYDILIAGHSA